MADTNEELGLIKDNYQKNEEKCILQYGCSMCGIVFDTEEVCDNHLRNCRSGEHDSQSKKSTYIFSDQTPNEHLSIPERLEDTYFENSLIHVIESEEIRESDEYLEQQNSELDKQYGITSKMLSDNEIFITLPFDRGYACPKKIIEYCDDMSLGIENINAEYETETGDKFQLSPKNVITKTGVVTNNTNNKVIIKQHKIVKKEFTKSIHKDSNLVLTKFDATKESVGENGVENIMENDRDKNPTSGGNSQSLENCGEQNTKLEAKESKKGILYSETNRYRLIKPKEYASKQDAKRKKQKQYTQACKRRKSQKEMQILIEKTKQALNNADCTDNEDVTPQCQKTNKFMYTVINKEKPKEPDDQGEFKVYEFVDEEEERAKKHLQKQKEKKKEEKKKMCLYCEKTFENPMEVLRHKREAHKFQKFTLSRKELLQYLDTDNYTECPLCSKSINQAGYRSVYVRHIETHCDEYNYKCRICGLAFRRGDHCEAHEKRHVVSLG